MPTTDRGEAAQAAMTKFLRAARENPIPAMLRARASQQRAIDRALSGERGQLR